MDSSRNSVSPMPEMAPIAEFDKSPPSPTELSPPLTAPMDDLPPPPSADDGKKKELEDGEEWGCGRWCEYLLVVTLGSLLLVACLTLVLFWTIYYRGGFAWREDPQKQFNLHPVLMVGGYIFFSGFSLLLYRICRCCRRVYVKLFHGLLHLLTIPCVVLGFLAVWDYHNLSIPPLPHFYSLHSWLGIATSGLFVLQFVVGLFSFVVLLCCEGATAAFRAALVPVHSTFGITTFMLAVATCVTGLTEKAFLELGRAYAARVQEAYVINVLAATLIATVVVLAYGIIRERESYKEWTEEGFIINGLAAALIALGVLLSFAVRRSTLRGPSPDTTDWAQETL